MARFSIVSLATLAALSSVAEAVPKNDLTKADVVVNDNLTPTDIKRIVDIAKFKISDLSRTTADLLGVDIGTGTVKITNADKTVRDSYIEYKVIGDETDYPRFRMFCESKVKFVIDMAVFKGMQDIGPLASFHGQVVEGLWNACSHNPNAANKAFVQKIKTLHFTLLGPTCTTHPYSTAYKAFDYAFNAKTGEMTVGLCFFGGVNIAESVEKWVSQQ